MSRPSPPRRSPLRALVRRRLLDPVALVLLVATAVSAALGELVDATIIFAIVVASALVSFRQEYAASRAVAELLDQVQVTARVVRDGQETAVGVAEVCRGDVVRLRTGDVVPADCRLLSAVGLQVDESALTGEAFAVDKHPDAPEEADRRVSMGSHVVSGIADAVAVEVGDATELGDIAALLGQTHQTGFERGLHDFGRLLAMATAVLVGSLFVMNAVLGRPPLESLLFSLALAVGLTPQLLPVIVAVTLSVGARRMAREHVIVKRLDAIEDLGAMSVLCTDKTGTLTLGRPDLVHTNDALDRPSTTVFELAVVNARHQQGFANPLDQAILRHPGADTVDVGVRLGEAPYDFDRKRLSVLVDRHDGRWIVTKGALADVLTVCTGVEVDGAVQPIERHRAALDVIVRRHSDEGDRVLGIARRESLGASIDAADECDLRLVGFLAFSDPVRPDATEELTRLRDLGVRVCLVTGDSRLAAAHLAATVGLEAAEIVTGEDVAALDDAQLADRVGAAVVFAEVHPAHKQRIVAALQRAGHTVGFLGDGINDAPAIQRADVGISVDHAVDVAKQAAAVVLLRQRLGVVADAVLTGRRTFTNTLKYVNVTISANFGNMLSLAVASAAIPFLPLLPLQILLLNFLSDVPAGAIATDAVDRAQLDRPQRWRVDRIRRFMIVFGAISSVFDLTTFAVLRLAFDAEATVFRSGWFIESMLTELAAMLVLRTPGRAWRSRPGTGLAVASVVVAIVTVSLPFTAVGHWMGFGRPSLPLVGVLFATVIAYVVVTEWAKTRWHGQ